MTDIAKVKLGYFLINSIDYDWRTALYLPKEREHWDLETIAIVANPDDFEEYDDTDNPIDMSNIGYTYVLLSDDVTSIFEYYNNGKDNYTESDIFTAFLFYLENDAFKD